MYRVSLAVCCYKQKKWLNRCLRSVASQTLDRREFEVIVINDGSIDDTAGIAQSYGEKIIYLEQDNAGQGAARNAGLDIATGDFIAFLDADDFWKPEFLERCTAFLEETPDAVAVNTGLIMGRIASFSTGH